MFLSPDLTPDSAPQEPMAVERVPRSAARSGGENEQPIERVK